MRFCVVLLCLLQAQALRAQLPFDSPEYPTGEEPFGLDVGDLNGDGIPDIVTADLEGTVSILVSDASGILHLEALVDAGSEARDVALADVDGDGDRDIFVAAEPDSFLLFNNPAVPWGADRFTFNLFASQPVVRLANLGSDGRPDLLFANGGSLYVALNPGDGRYDLNNAAVYDSAINARFMEVADLNGDRQRDVALTVASGDDDLLVYLNSGGGVFADPVSYGGMETSRGVDSGDLDGDGDNDLVVADLNPSLLHVLTNDGAGAFIASATVALPENPQGLALQDVDGDGNVDAVVALTRYNGGGAMAVVPGNGDGTFGTPLIQEIGHSPYDLQLVDMDGDNVADVVASNEDGDTVSVIQGFRDGTFNAETLVDVSTTTTGVGGGDLNLDGRAELLAHVNDNPSLLIYELNTAGEYVPSTSYYLSRRIPRMLITTVNSDAWPDLIASDQTISIRYGLGSLDLSGRPVNVVDRADTNSEFVYEDLNGDGLKDFASLGPRINLAEATALFPQSARYDYGGTHGIAAGDLEGDGDLDLVMADRDLDGVIVAVNDGDGFYPDHFMVGGILNPYYVALQDLDGDSDGDLAVVDRSAAELQIYENIGNATFDAPVIFPLSELPSDLAAADIDGDTDIDLLVPVEFGHHVAVFFNDGNGNFQEIAFGTDQAPRSLQLVDVEGDGDLDIFTANSGSFNVIENRTAPSDLYIEATGGTLCDGFVGGTYRAEFAVGTLGPGESFRARAGFQSGAPLTTVEYQGQVISGTGVIVLDLGTLRAGAPATVTVSVMPDATGTLSIVGQALPSGKDPDFTNNMADHTFSVQSVPAGLDLAIDAMEFTQGIQNLANDVPLFRFKQSQVRVYVSSTHALAGVPVQLTAVDRSGRELDFSPLHPSNDCVVLSPTGYDRADFTQSYNFGLPWNWEDEDYVLTAEVNPGGAVPEADLSNNTRSMDVEFYHIRPICVKTYACWTEDASANTLQSSEVVERDVRQRALTQLPTHQVRYYPQDRVLKKFSFTGPVPYKLGARGKSDTFHLLDKLWLIDQTSSEPRQCREDDARTHYMAIVHKDSDTKFGGMAFITDQSWVKVSDSGSGYEYPFGGHTLAHELGHNYQRFHVRCGGSGGDPKGPYNGQYPYDPCQFSPVDPAGYYGLDLFDWQNPRVIAPVAISAASTAWVGDLMSYADQTWISDYNWRDLACRLFMGENSGCRVFNPFEVKPSLAPEMAREEARYKVMGTGEVLFVTGYISDTTGEFRRTLRQPLAEVIEQKVTDLYAKQMRERLMAKGVGSASAYAVELFDSEQNLLHAEGFVPEPTFDNDAGYLYFGLVLPFMPEVASIEVRNVTEGLLDTRPVSEHAPTVDIVRPSADEMQSGILTVEWTADDADGDDLYYMVQYSPDMGMNWETLAFEIYSTTLAMPVKYLAGSDNMSLVRVIANDGVNTGSDTSEAFTLEKRGPVVSIETPGDESVLPAGQLVTVSGTAFDPEEEFLSGASLAWFLNGQVKLGSGEELTVEPLPTGEHTLTLRAIDSDGQAGEDTVTVRVGTQPDSKKGDLNKDGLVGALDLLELIRQAEGGAPRAGYGSADLNDDGVVDHGDVILFREAWGAE